MDGPSAQPPHEPALTALWLAISAILALFVGTGAGVLGWLAGERTAAAVLTGLGYVGGTMTLTLVVIALFRR